MGYLDEQEWSKITTLPEIYDYLVRSRHDLWAAFEAVPNEVLSRPLAGDDWYPCLKDLVFHLITVEDGWVNMDILREEPVLMQHDALKDIEDDAVCGVEMRVLLNYWQAVEQKTLSYLATLTDNELSRSMTPHDDPDTHYEVSGLLHHVMFHEMRHTAQIAVLLRSQAIKPPSLDLLFYLPSA